MEWLVEMTKRIIGVAIVFHVVESIVELYARIRAFNQRPKLHPHKHTCDYHQSQYAQQRNLYSFFSSSIYSLCFDAAKVHIVA